MQYVWYHPSQLSQAMALWFHLTALVQTKQGDLGVLGPGFGFNSQSADCSMIIKLRYSKWWCLPVFNIGLVERGRRLNKILVCWCMELSKSFGYLFASYDATWTSANRLLLCKGSLWYAEHVDITKYVTIQGIRKMFVDILTNVCLLPVFSKLNDGFRHRNIVLEQGFLVSILNRWLL